MNPRLRLLEVAPVVERQAGAHAFLQFDRVLRRFLAVRVVMPGLRRRRIGCGGDARRSAGVAGERSGECSDQRQCEGLSDSHAAPFFGTQLIACSVMAVIVSDGFTPGLAGTVDPSQTRKFR